MMHILKKYWYLGLILLIMFLFYFIIPKDEVEVIATEEIEVVKEDIVEEDSDEIYYVDIKGEVKKPGVYEVKPGDRVIDVIKLAGGLTKNANVSILNLSKKVKDEMNIRIYSNKDLENALKTVQPEVVEVVKEVEKIVEKECNCESNIACDLSNSFIDNDADKIIDENDVKININTATKEQLESIPGIGSSKAENIIEYRNNNKFETIDDIKKVTGIGESLFEKIKYSIIT